MTSKLSQAAEALLVRLREVASKGPVPTVRGGPTGVGITLMRELGLVPDHFGRAVFRGVALKASRSLGEVGGNRVNLFACVPDWGLSTCKSTQEMLEKHGYGTGDERRLNCTVRANRPNGQGLLLRVGAGLLEECVEGREEMAIVAWQVAALVTRLKESRPEAVWVQATSSNRDGVEFLQYRRAVYTGPPRVERFVSLLRDGAITVDHLISCRNGRVIEKGPLFKIAPQNFSLLFPTSFVFDLCS